MVQLLPLFSAWILGNLAVCLAWPRLRGRSDWLIIGSLGVGVGLGITSALFFWASLTPWPTRVAFIAEGIVGLILVCALCRARKWPFAGRCDERGAPTCVVVRAHWLKYALVAVFAVGFAVFITIAERSYRAEPYGGWDAWAIWNMRARMIFTAGSGWPELAAQPMLAWTHPDYPLLLPSSVARGWVFLGADTPFYSAAVSTAFALAAVTLLGALLYRLAGLFPALMACVVLLGTPAFLAAASNQHADLPLAFFYLATVGLIALTRTQVRTTGLHVLVGACVGFSAWTKNEGLLFALVTGGVLVIAAFRARSFRSLGAFVAGAVFVLLPLLHFKLCYAPPNDLMSAAKPVSGELFDVGRHGLILKALWRDFVGFGGWSVPPIWLMAAGLLVAVAVGKNLVSRATAGVIGVILGLTLLGYYAVYLVTSRDLQWHLDSSLVRLLMQLWPASVFLWAFLLVGWLPRRAVTEGAVCPGRSRRWLLASLVSCGVFFAIYAGLKFQAKEGELGQLTLSRASLTVTPGDGWYGLEKTRKHRWLWSGGSASLVVHVENDDLQSGGTFSVTFGLRSLDRREIKILFGDRTVWEGAIDRSLNRIQLQGLSVPSSKEVLKITSASAAVPESDQPGARGLAFAIYDLELER